MYKIMMAILCTITMIACGKSDPKRTGSWNVKYTETWYINGAFDRVESANGTATFTTETQGQFQFTNGAQIPFTYNEADKKLTYVDGTSIVAPLKSEESNRMVFFWSETVGNQKIDTELDFTR